MEPSQCPNPLPLRPPLSEEAAASGQDPDYWPSLINEDEAADFLGLTNRTMQAMRQRGDGPRFIRISSRCIRYTRALLKSHTDALVRQSTNDAGQAAT